MECGSLIAHWEKLSSYLGLDDSSIAVIRGNHPLDLHGCWSAALSHWIRQNYSAARHGLPSWRTLLRAVARVDRLLFKKLSIQHGELMEGIGVVLSCLYLCPPAPPSLPPSPFLLLSHPPSFLPFFLSTQLETVSVCYYVIISGLFHSTNFLFYSHPRSAI